MKNLEDRNCMLPCSHKRFTHPTPKDVSEFLKKYNLSHSEIATLLGISCSPKFGSSTIRRWVTLGKTSHHIPYPTWRLLLIYAGVVNFEDDVKQIEGACV